MTRWDPHENGCYWVVGGRYADVSFRVCLSGHAFGPFSTRYDAEACWRSLSFAKTHDAQTRFTILEDDRVARAA